MKSYEVMSKAIPIVFSVLDAKVIKKVYVLCILLFVGFTIKGQNYDDIIHDLHQKLESHASKDEARVDLLNDLSYAYRRSSPAKIDTFAQKALHLAKELDYLKGKAMAYKNLGIAGYKLGNNPDTTIALYQKCYELSKIGGDYYNQVACLNNIGLSYRYRLQYTEAIQNFQNAYEIHERYLPIGRLRLLIIGNMGQAYINMEDYENARLYLERLIVLAEKEDNEAILAMYMADYAFAQYKEGEVKEAVKTIIKYLPTTKAIGDYQTFARATRFLSDIFIEEQQFDKAAHYIEQGLQISEEYNFPLQKCQLMLNRSRVLMEQKKLVEALEAGEYAYDCAEERMVHLQQMKAAKHLVGIYLANQDISKAQELFPVYNELSERHFNTEQQEVRAILEAQYQNRQKEAENAHLKTQKLKNEETIKVQRILGGFILLLTLWAAGGAWFAYYIKRTQNALLEQKVEERTKALSEANQELEHSNQKLEKSNEELERFAYIASHDLKQPLNTVISFSQLLHKELEDTASKSTQDYLDFIMNSSNQMKRLIEDILEYSKLSEQKRAPQIIDLNVLVEEVEASILDMIKRKNVQINVIGTLPTLKQEKTKMVLLFKNLIENGIKYNQSKIPIISIQQCKYESFTRMSFTDNGIGIEEKHFSKLFKMFSRLHHGKDYEGTGLGLSLCKKIVQNMGGTISIESQLGEGSTFHVDIPGELIIAR